MSRILNRELLLGGKEYFIGASNTRVRVLERDHNKDILKASGSSVPTDGDSGYAKGCVFIKTDGSETSVLYINEGSKTSASFNVFMSGKDSAGLGGLYIKKTALAVYDFAVDGGAIGAIVLADAGTLPNNAVCTAITYDVLTTCTSSTDAGTIALSLPTDGALSTAIAISDATNPWDAGVHLGSVITPIAVKTTASRAIGITVATEAITAGKIVFAVDYYVSQ